jgi:hypothetical protein
MILSLHLQYSVDCSSIIRLEFFCATFVHAITISFVFRQVSSVLLARKRAVAATVWTRVDYQQPSPYDLAGKNTSFVICKLERDNEKQNFGGVRNTHT